MDTLVEMMMKKIKGKEKIELNCIFYRVNPDKKGFSVFVAIREIRQLIEKIKKQSNKLKKEQDDKMKEPEDEIKKFKLQLTNQSV